MKTTIEIPDELASEAKQVAREGGATLHDLVISGLRSEIDARTRRIHADVSFPTQNGRGLVAGLSPAEAIARSYDEAL